ncbi:RtcB family protein, partial [Cytophagia bacterium CHB2]|nr:RtcB family protein [Cytophagia bacterium CHB2]
MSEIKLKKISDYLWEIPPEGNMLAPARIYAAEKMLKNILADNAPQQAMNVAHLPGIVGYSLAMPDIHWGYGFPIGGVAAFDVDSGVISPGGVGYDINCGVRLMASSLTLDEVKPKMQELVKALFHHVPTGVGSEGKVKLAQKELEQIMTKGAHWAIKNGYSEPDDLEFIEENGLMPGALPDKISKRASERGRPQLGTLGSGNHFLEVGYVAQIFNANAAAALGLFQGQITVIIHCGSRGFGHQVCEDYLGVMNRAVHKY